MAYTLSHNLTRSEKISGYKVSTTIEDQSQVELILRSYADLGNRKILEAASSASKTIMEILNTCDVPQSSAYRKIITLIANGLLIPDGFVVKNERKMIKYMSIFEDITINILHNKAVAINVKLTARR